MSILFFIHLEKDQKFTVYFSDQKKAFTAVTFINLCYNKEVLICRNGKDIL